MSKLESIMRRIFSVWWGPILLVYGIAAVLLLFLVICDGKGLI